MSFRKLMMAAAAAATMAVAVPAQAVQVILVFGQTSSGTPFTATQNAPGGAATATTYAMSAVPIEVTSFFGGNPPTPFAAFMSFNVTSTGVATVTGGGNLEQVLGAGTFAITQNADGSGANYLSGDFSRGVFSGIGGSAGIGSSANSVILTDINFTSSLIGPLLPPESLQLSLDAIDPPLSLSGGGGANICGTTVCSFVSSVAGNFSADVSQIPAPASLVLLGMGLLGLGVVARRKAA